MSTIEQQQHERLTRLGERMAVMAATNGALDNKQSADEDFAKFLIQCDGLADIPRELVARRCFSNGFNAGFYAGIEAVRKASRQGVST